MNIRTKLLAGSLSVATLMPIMVFAQSSVSSSSATGTPAACTAALDAQHAAKIAMMDKRIATEKAALQTLNTALKAAVAITDETARKAAIKAANDAFHQTMKDAMPKNTDEMKTQMEAFKTACSGLLPGKPGVGKMMGKMRGGMPGHHGKGWFGR